MTSHHVSVNLAAERKRLEGRRNRIWDAFNDGVISAEERKEQIALTNAQLAALPNSDGLPCGGIPGALSIAHLDLVERLRRMLAQWDGSINADIPRGFVYLVETLEGPHRIKVGFAIHPDSRLKALQTGSPVRLALRNYWPGTMVLERGLHEILFPHRVHLEWFDGAAAGAIEEVMRGREA